MTAHREEPGRGRASASRRALVFGALGAAGCGATTLYAPWAIGQGAAPAPLDLPWATVTVRTAAGASHRFATEIADTPAARSRGLMFRRQLPADQAMLFVYPRAQHASFWMRNTLIPLDMVFIDADGRVVKVHAEAIPHDETPIPSGAPVRAVLEVAGGEAARRGITAGDRVWADAARALLPEPGLAPVE